MLSVTAFNDPVREMDKLHTLYDSLMDARRQHGEDVVPFHKFAALVKNQVTQAARRGQPGSRVPRRREGRKGGVYGAGDGCEGERRDGVERVRQERTGDRSARRAPVSCRGLAGLGDVAGLRAFGAVDDFELDRLAFLERPEAVALDRREVNEDVSCRRHVR